MYRGIVCMSLENRVIGNDDKLAWGKKDGDLAYFKHLTQQFGANVVMGSKTWEGMGCCHLNGRTVYVLSKKDWGWQELVNERGVVRIIKGIEELPNNVGDFWIAGGKTLYETMLPYLQEFWVTELKKSFEGNVIMPPFEERFKNKDLAHEEEHYKSWRYY